MDVEKLKYPIGTFDFDKGLSEKEVEEAILEIKLLPQKLESITENISVGDLQKRYRPGGWKIKQVIHHIADSHMNSLLRFKWTLTEETPIIKAYNEVEFAKLPDYDLNIKYSVDFLHYLHAKLGYLLGQLSAEDLEKRFIHPADRDNEKYTLRNMIGMYSWHGQHHLAHIRNGLSHGFDE